MTEQKTERHPNDILQFLLIEEALPELVEHTGIVEKKWRSIMNEDGQFGLRTRVVVMPSEVRWRALLHKYINFVADCEGTDFLEDHSFDVPDLSPEDRELLRKAKDEG